jgi:3-oxoacyl-[acyl-carrier-protein] synthase-3
MLFGDCGTATMVTAGKSPISFSIHSDGSGYDSLIVPAGGFRNPINEETSKIKYDKDNNGRTDNNMYMNGIEIFNFAISNVPVDINELIANVGWEKEEVGLFALHQANEFMVKYIQKRLKIPPEKTPINVKNYGNTGPASIPLLLSDICESKHFQLNKVIMSGFGVGLSWGSIACDMNETNFYEPINK